MMNYIWAGLVVIAVIAGGVTGTMNDVLNNLFDFAQTAVDISLGLIGIMAFFCGLMRVMEKAGMCEALGKAISPVMRLLFPEVPADHPANSIMAIYFAANILGIGNAATPFGLRSMQELQTLNKTKDIASDAQAMLLAVATTSITLIPVTAIAFRAKIQTEGAAEIVVPVIIATTISTVTGIFFTIIFGKTKRWNYQACIDREIAAGTIQINENYIGPDPIVLPDDYVSAEDRDESYVAKVEKAVEEEQKEAKEEK
ncbi:nucleoside recognition domain-containing protein [Hornefia butyriciproducens]|uniref:Nucleoside recognition protein n=1 Tax=Hornefia butyriciproducens TaxID=2652293 RepID=A0A6L5Y3I2_9FIRM|nr:nucleoside recognition domain-containing protein [Hornefia butyriciproducens]MCI7326473.1 nucleoside recognition protein [Clostridiales bacterium]MCI7678857.1 nucleoside recognition protein [Clostridiales bacterium]MDD6299036.1 nucleoside recognition domain-containing protein [Hornefia butyriciproducens]MDY2991370.1 nucleoside recognition domain-containing protein [Hornefia butyriciproducens]MDY5464110.1 nucleoside recognition domain-containing protein [Hornefia butyriciproducens]